MPRRARPEWSGPASRGNLHRTSARRRTTSPASRRFRARSSVGLRAQPLRVPPAHRGPRPVRPPRRHVVRRAPGPRVRRRDLRLGHHDPVREPRRRDVPRPEAGPGQRDPAQRPRRSTSTCSTRGRLPLDTVAGSNELVVDAVMRFRNDGEGLHRSVDPADGGTTSTACRSWTRRPRIFACFDQPDLKAPYTFHVTAPADWTVIGNAPGAAGRSRASGSSSRPSRCRRTSSPWSPGPYHLIRDEHDGIPLGLQRPASIAARPRRGRRRAVHDDQAVLRRVPPAVRHPLPVRRLPPGVRAGVQRRRDGEPRLRHVPRPARSSPARVTRGMRIAARHHRRARDGAPVVRQHRHPEVVGRPVAQRVVRRVHGQPGHRRRHRVRRRLGRQRLRAPPVGADRRPAPEHPPGRRQRRGRRVRRAAGLRRHLVRQGLEHPQAAQRHPRRRGVLRRRDRPLHPAPLRQRDHARPVRELGARRGGRPVGVHRQLAAHRRARTPIVLDREAGVHPSYSPGRRTRPTAPHTLRVAIAAPTATWRTDAARPSTRPGDAVRRAGGRAGA